MDSEEIIHDSEDVVEELIDTEPMFSLGDHDSEIPEHIEEIETSEVVITTNNDNVNSPGTNINIRSIFSLFNLILLQKNKQPSTVQHNYH